MSVALGNVAFLMLILIVGLAVSGLVLWIDNKLRGDKPQETGNSGQGDGTSGFM